jgi:hypothetical protein
MSDDRPSGDLTREERDALSGARQDRDAPAQILEAVVADLRQRGLLRHDQRRATAWRAASWAAGLAAAFLAGWLAASLAHPGEIPSPAGARYMLLLYEDEGFQRGGPADRERRVREYSAWARTLAAEGRLVAGDELDDDGTTLTPAGVRDAPAGQPVSARPSGYFIIVAPDEAGAMEIARTCPHLLEGGRVVVRRIVD